MNEVAPEDFLAGGQTNLLEMMTRISQKVFETNSYRIFDLQPGVVARLSVADAIEQEALQLDAQERMIPPYED